MFLFGSLQSISPFERHQNMGVKFLCITSLTSTCPLSCLDVFFSSRAFQSICKEQTITLPIYGLFRDLHGTSLVITSTRSNPVLVLVTRDSQLGLCLPHYLQTSLRSPLYILRYFPCIKFPHTHPQIFLNSSWISLHSLNLIFPLIRHLILSLSKIPSSLTKSTQQVLLSQHGISHVLI